MECFPPCVTCTGLCQQMPPAVVTAPRETRTKTTTPERKPGYIVLVCGHYTTWEEQIATPGFRKSRKRYWCDKHQHWANAYTFAERIAQLQEEPLF